MYMEKFIDTPIQLSFRQEKGRNETLCTTKEFCGICVGVQIFCLTSHVPLYTLLIKTYHMSVYFLKFYYNDFSYFNYLKYNKKANTSPTTNLCGCRPLTRQYRWSEPFWNLSFYSIFCFIESLIPFILRSDL